MKWFISVLNILTFGILICTISILGSGGCFKTTNYTDDDNNNNNNNNNNSKVDSGMGTGAQQGDPCAKTEDCGEGLVCSGLGVCALDGAPGTKKQDEGCSFNTDCLSEFICSSTFQCVPPGTGTEGGTCQGNEDCIKGLLCSSTKTCAKPGAVGTKGPNEKCEAILDCALGLLCLEGICTPLTFWTGATCTEDSGPLRAYFEVPRTEKTLADFYRLPFPNNIRFKDGHVQVLDHPNPAGMLPKEYQEIVETFLKAINEDVTGFGVNTSTYFRISKSFNLNTLSLSGSDATLQYLNIDKQSAAYGNSISLTMFASTGRGKYICPNHIVLRPTAGNPLLPKTTYAVMLRKGIKDDKGNEVGQDEDFKTVIAETEPADADLNAAWKAYQPLRDFLKENNIDPSTVLSAAVFTTMDPQEKMATFRETVHSQPAPAVTKLTLCDGNNKSPCEDADNPTHVCPTTPSTDFHELQGLYDTPVFQAGKPPYKAIADGGQITFSEGKPIVQRSEQACFSLAVPKETMPANGWPVVIFAHGTGGNYRSYIGNNVAAGLANVKDESGTIGRIAVISIDGSMHGPRRGSTDKPDDLFFNLRNPRAARDNIYQGAADKFQLVRLLKSMDLDNATSPTGEPIKFDLSKIYYFGHSQGTIEGIPFLAFEPDVQGSVLSGAGGFLLASFLEKTKPVNIAGMVKFALADSALGYGHPMLNLLQLLYEEVDSVNYAKAQFTTPNNGISGKHTFLSYGIADSYSPPSTISPLASAMGIPLAKQAAQRCGDNVCNGTESCKTCEADCQACPSGSTCGDGKCEGKENCGNCQEDCNACPSSFPLVDLPLLNNKTSNGKKITAGMVQYVSDGTYDDHFVLFNNPLGTLQYTKFLGTGARDESPSIINAP